MKNKILELDWESGSPMEEIQRLMNNLSGEDKVRMTFMQNAGIYWGKVGKVRVSKTKETEKGTKYYLIVADIIKNQEKMKLLQEWFIGKDGTPKPASGKNITIPDDFADEISLMVSDEFICN